jgi:hypothetical protein
VAKVNPCKFERGGSWIVSLMSTIHVMIKKKKDAGIQKGCHNIIFQNRPRRFAGKHRNNKHILAFS